MSFDVPPSFGCHLTPWDLLLRQWGESSIKDTNQGLVVTCRLERDGGNLERSQRGATEIKRLEFRPPAGMPETTSPPQLLCG